jgi:CTP:molybdopterin cytidylyltransferase MocA
MKGVVEAVTGLILSAGGSTRMGQPKGLLRRDGVPLLRAQVLALQAAGLPVTVVLGFRAAEHCSVLPPGVRVELNLRWARTDMAASAALGLRGPVLLQPVDVPPPTPETLRALLSVPEDLVPVFEGQEGHPVRLQPPHPPGRLDLRLRSARRIPVKDPHCIRNLNRPADWADWVSCSEPVQPED